MRRLIRDRGLLGALNWLFLVSSAEDAGEDIMAGHDDILQEYKDLVSKCNQCAAGSH